MSTENLSRSTRIGSDIRECSSGLEFTSAWESASELSAALVGVGTIGEPTGTTTRWYTTTTPTTPTARPSIAVEDLAIIVISMADLRVTDLTVAHRWVQAAYPPEIIPAPSAASIMAASRTH